eukprot:6207990-Pleurochrysis_carterae.AAC.1
MHAARLLCTPRVKQQHPGALMPAHHQGTFVAAYSLTGALFCVRLSNVCSMCSPRTCHYSSSQHCIKMRKDNMYAFCLSRQYSCRRQSLPPFVAPLQALISVSQEPPALDAAYLHERSRMYASAIAANPSMLPPGVKVDRRIPLAAPPASTD